MKWKPVAEVPPPRDGRELLMKRQYSDGSAFVRVCTPKQFPRPLERLADVHNIDSQPGDIWEYHRDERHAPGHTWSMIPTHWMEIPA